MKFLRRPLAKSCAKRIVLVLQEGKAYWFHVVDGKVINTFIESVDEQSFQQLNHPAWLDNTDASKPVVVELLLDTTLDEVDRISVEKSGRYLIDKYRQWTTLMRLRNDYPKASVYTLPSGYRSQVAAVMHPAQPVSWGPWLLAVQSRGIVFYQVCTGTELVAHWSKQFNRRVLVVMQTGNYQKHLLVDTGACVFLRTLSVKVSAFAEKRLISSATRTAIEQSIAYIDDVVEPECEEIAVVALHADSTLAAADVTTGSQSHLPISIADSNNMSTIDATPAGLLINMLLNVTIHYECEIWRDGNLQAIPSDHGNLTLAAMRSSQERSWLARACHRLRDGSVNRSLAAPDWSLLKSVARWTEALAPSVQYQKASGLLAAVLKLSLVMAVLATLAVGAALTHGYSSARALLRQNTQIDDNRKSANELQAKLVSRYKAPNRSADALFLLDHLRQLSLLPPHALLDTIATAVTAVPSVSLDRMAWVVVDDNDRYDALPFALASVGHRQLMQVTSANAVVQLELEGRVAGANLQQRKRQLDHFIDVLESMPAMLEVNVLESPADAALTSTAESAEHEMFRLSLLMVQS